ncbi:MAG: hypothetical protein AB1505_10910 [Candidatus Latescibacterota bacterium]
MLTGAVVALLVLLAAPCWSLQRLELTEVRHAVDSTKGTLTVAGRVLNAGAEVAAYPDAWITVKRAGRVLALLHGVACGPSGFYVHPGEEATFAATTPLGTPPAVTTPPLDPGADLTFEVRFEARWGQKGEEFTTTGLSVLDQSLLLRDSGGRGGSICLGGDFRNDTGSTVMYVTMLAVFYAGDRFLGSDESGYGVPDRWDPGEVVSLTFGPWGGVAYADVTRWEVKWAYTAVPAPSVVTPLALSGWAAVKAAR